MRAIVFFLALITAEAVAAYPIDPRPLRKLVMESEYIVTAHVLEIVTHDNPKDAFDNSETARLKIYEVLQGDIRQEVVEVPFYPHIICPAPAQYVTGTDVLVFLSQHEGKFYTHAMSYGVKTLSADDMEVYKARIREMQTILKIDDQYKQFFEIVEWLVKCAEHPATRWEGTYELSPESDFMSYYAQSELIPFGSLLSADQRMRLKDALFRTETAAAVDLGLIDLVYRGNENEVHAFLLKHLRTLPDEYLWYAGFFMDRVMQGKKTKEMERVAERFSEVQFQYDDQKELRALIDRFVGLADE